MNRTYVLTKKGGGFEGLNRSLECHKVMKHTFSSLNEVVDRRFTKDSLNTYRFDFAPFFNRKRKKNGHFFTLRGESGDLEELFSSLFVYLMLIV